MLIYLLIALTVIQLLRTGTIKSFEIDHIMNYLLPYWKKGDEEDKLLGIVQLVFITGISLLKALKTDSCAEGILVFLFTFISFIWLIKLLVVGVAWISDYIRMITANVVFTLLVPVLIFINISHIEGRLEIDVCLIALLMSLCIVYMELINMTLGREKDEKGNGRLRNIKNLKLKKIFTWLGIILVNLYTLIVFIQFYWESDTYHFIETHTFNAETAVDLFYYLIVTFTTVGLGDIQPHTEVAKLVTALVALSGMFFTGIFVSVILSMEEKNKKME